MRSSNPERTNSIISAKAKARWADPDYKERVASKMRDRKRSSLACEHVREAMLKYYAAHPKPSGNYKKRFCACGCGVLIRDAEKASIYVNREHKQLAMASRKPEKFCPVCGRNAVKGCYGFCSKDCWSVSQSAKSKRIASDPAYLKKMSHNMKKVWREHPEKFCNQGSSYSQCKKGLVHTDKGGLVKYDSSWELAFVEIIESASILKRFKKNPFPIWYLFEGKRLRYYPDFLLEFHDGRKFVVEIKGRTDEKTIFKHAAAYRYCQEHGYEWAVIQEKPVESLSRYLQ